MGNLATFDLAQFSPVAAIIGGLFLGVFTFTFFQLLGRPFGVSGNVRLAMLPFGRYAQSAPGEYGIRICFVVGMISSGIVAAIFHPHLLQEIPVSPSATPKWGGNAFWYIRYLAGGVLVGLGTCMSNGCTSGHGLAGLSRMSARSFVAVCCFMAAAMACGTAMNTSRDFPLPARGVAVASPERSASAYVAVGASALVLAMVYSPTPYLRSSGTAEDPKVRKLRVYATAFTCAFGFGTSLALGGMALPSKLAAFLDFRSWDASLAFFMAGAHAIQMPLTQLFIEPMVREGTPPALCLLAANGQVAGDAEQFGWTIRGLNKNRIDKPLVFGAAIFGVGWALSCACPGPALLRLAANDEGAWPPLHNLLLSVGWLLCFALGSACNWAKDCDGCDKTCADSISRGPSTAPGPISRIPTLASGEAPLQDAKSAKEDGAEATSVTIMTLDGAAEPSPSSVHVVGSLGFSDSFGAGSPMVVPASGRPWSNGAVGIA